MQKEKIREWIYVEDHCEALYKILKKEKLVKVIMLDLI